MAGSNEKPVEKSQGPQVRDRLERLAASGNLSVPTFQLTGREHKKTQKTVEEGSQSRAACVEKLMADGMQMNFANSHVMCQESTSFHLKWVEMIFLWESLFVDIVSNAT